MFMPCAYIGRGLFALAFALVLINRALASVQPTHVTYDVLPEFAADAFSASWLHGATGGPPHGSPENGALLNGPTTSRISGNLEGDLLGNILTNATGSISGSLKQLASYLNNTYGTSYTTSTPFELKLGGSANGGAGALAFETNGSGTGQFTGGFLDFSLFVGGSVTSLLDGTFFFKPQAESGSAALSPNRGTSAEFTLWGWNWMHDGAPVDGGAEPGWESFLSSLGYSGPMIERTPLDGPALESPLGVALYVADADPPSLGANPEPTAALVWGLLVVCAAANSLVRPPRS
jgi:hypothetical protein